MGREGRAAAIVEMMGKHKQKPDEAAPVVAEGESPSDEHKGIAQDLHDAVHGHDMDKLAEVIQAIHAMAHGGPPHAEPDGDEAPGE